MKVFTYVTSSKIKSIPYHHQNKFTKFASVSSRLDFLVAIGINNNCHHKFTEASFTLKQILATALAKKHIQCGRKSKQVPLIVLLK